VIGVLLPAAVLGTLGGALATVLWVAARRFHVEEDPLIDIVEAELPGANCGVCGLAGCRAFAESLVSSRSPEMLCPPGGVPVSERVADILGIEASARHIPVAVVMCRGSHQSASHLGAYAGIKDCRAAAAIEGNTKLCPFGCVGFGSCARVCHYDAISMTDGVAVVDESRCLGCGACAEACPIELVEMVPRESRVYVACRSLDAGRQVKQLCSVGCIGCKKCVKACELDAITCPETLATVNQSLCSACGACIASCPKYTVVGVHLDEQARARAQRPPEKAKRARQ